MSMSTKEKTKLWGSHARPATEYPYRVVPKPARTGLPTGDFTSRVGLTQRQIPKHYPAETTESDWVNKDYGSASIETLAAAGIMVAALGVIVFLVTRNTQTVSTAAEKNVL